MAEPSIGLNLYMSDYEIATYIVKYKFAQSCKSKVAGSVSLRCWPEVLLCGVVVRAGNDIIRSSPLSSAGVLSSEGLCYGILGSLRQERRSAQ